MAGVIFDDVTKEFPGGTVAVDHLSLDVADGEFMILVGPSGCGKTTALRMVAGLEKPTSGTISVGDRVVNHVSPRDRDIAMVFQNYALYPHMSVRKNLAFGLRQRHTPKPEVERRVRETSAMLGLEDLLGRRPAQLSGGQRQRVAMGRALVREPKVFLLDEPLSNLDAKLRVQMRSELKRLHLGLQVTTIYVTHDQVEAMTLGDRIAVISAGKIQQLGAPQDIYEQPANVFVAGFIGSPPMNLLRGTARGGRVAAGDLLVDMPAAPDGEVVVGLRPESLGTPSDGPAWLELNVDVVEPLGDGVIVHGTVAATVARSGAEVDIGLPPLTGERAEIVARLGARERPKVGETLRLGVDAAEVHLFDAETGVALN